MVHRLSDGFFQIIVAPTFAKGDQTVSHRIDWQLREQPCDFNSNRKRLSVGTALRMARRISIEHFRSRATSARSGENPSEISGANSSTNRPSHLLLATRRFSFRSSLNAYRNRKFPKSTSANSWYRMISPSRSSCGSYANAFNCHRRRPFFSL